MQSTKTHTLKVYHTDFDAVYSGENPMLIRRDAGCKMGDEVRLIRYSGLGWGDVDAEAPVLKAWVAAITRGGSAGLLPGYVVLSLADIDQERVAA